MRGDHAGVQAQGSRSATSAGGPALLSHPLFEAAAAGRLRSALAGVAPRRIPSGTLLGTPGARPGRLHLVLEGRLRAYQVTADDRELLLELIEAGGFDGILSMAGHRGHFTEAKTDSVVASMSLDVLERLMGADPKVASNLLRLLTDRLSRREEHLETIALREPSQRLARQLLALGRTLGREQGDVIVIQRRLTHQMLADMLGVRRETATLHLHRLVELGAVIRSGSRMRIDTRALERIVDPTSDGGDAAPHSPG